MSLAHYFTHIAHLIGHPSRALMLDALLGAEALPATALAESAGISAQTASRQYAALARSSPCTKPCAAAMPQYPAFPATAARHR